MENEIFEESREVNWADSIEPKEEKKPKKNKKAPKASNTLKTKMQVIISILEVKDWADKDAPTIATLYKNDIVSVGREEGDYIEVKLTKSIAGYALKKFLR